MSLNDILETGVAVFREGNSPAAVTEEAMMRLQRSAFTESRKMLLFIYREAFLQAKEPSIHEG